MVEHLFSKPKAMGLIVSTIQKHNSDSTNSKISDRQVWRYNEVQILEYRTRHVTNGKTYMYQGI